MDAIAELQRLAHEAYKPKPPAGWFPSPHGGEELWYWTGQKWRDPEDMLEDQMSERLRPHMENMFVRGFQWGIAVKQQAKEQQPEEV